MFLSQKGGLRGWDYVGFEPTQPDGRTKFKSRIQISERSNHATKPSGKLLFYLKHYYWLVVTLWQGFKFREENFLFMIGGKVEKGTTFEIPFE